MSDVNKDSGSGEIGGNLSQDDQNVLRLWRESSSLLDMRYHSKVLLKLVARSMTDDRFRSRLVDDVDSVLDELEPGLPAGQGVRFFDNSPTMLNVVLPPPAGEMEKKPQALREALSSLTAEEITIFEDEWDLTNVGTKDTVFLPDEP